MRVAARRRPGAAAPGPEGRRACSGGCGTGAGSAGFRRKDPAGERRGRAVTPGTLSRRKHALVRRLHRRKTREREGAFLVEGVRSGVEALDAGAPVRFAVTSPRLEGLEDGPGLQARLEAAGVEVARVDDDAMAELADTETPQGVLLVVEEPDVSVGDLAAGTVPRLLLLDGVQDPGNVGTLVRVADAFGLTGVVALDGTVDPWNTKAVRAAAGGLFRVPVAAAAWDASGPALAAAGVPILAATADGAPVDRAEVPAGAWALAVGNEGAGVRSAVLDAARARVAVPMPGGAESLNVAVAGAILLYALTRSARP